MPMLALLLAGTTAVAAAAFEFPLDLAQGEARRSSAGVFRRGGGLVKQLWANCHTPRRSAALAAEVLTVEWDGLDSAGMRLLAGGDDGASSAFFELRWIDTSAVTYDWKGVVGNTGPATGQHVLRSEDWQQDLAIAGDAGVRAWGYNEGYPGCSGFSSRTPSEATSLAHSDYHRTFVLAATDGEVGYFVNSGGATEPASFFHTATTFVIGVDLESNCEHNFTTTGHPQCTVGTGQHTGGELSNWSWCKPAGSQCGYPGSDCANGGATKENYDGCNGKAEYFHSVIDYMLDPSLVNDTMDGQNPGCHPPKRCNGTGTSFLQAATGIAVQRTGAMLFIAHAFLHQVRVLDKKTGASLCNVTMDMPRRMSVSKDGSSLWVIVGNTSVSKFDTAKLCTSGGKPTPTVTLPKAQLTTPTALSVSPTTGDVAVADLATSQVQIFSSNGKYSKSLGTKGGYSTGGPAVSAGRFFWLDSTQVFMAHDDDGSIWVADAANLRTLHIDSNTGQFLGSVDYIVASYSSTVSSEQPSRVFSNYREYEVKYSGGKAPLNQSWSLVRTQ
jgi:hypothetical protein